MSPGTGHVPDRYGCGSVAVAGETVAGPGSKEGRKTARPGAGRDPSSAPGRARNAGRATSAG